MKFIGYWASQEQYSMQDLSKFVLEAEKGGFTSTMTSDHFHPWHHDGGFGNFTWIWLAVAAERTKNMKFVTGVTAPIFRYNPAIVAQAFASLDVLYPRRISLGIGTGEAMNEVSVGFDWPSPKIRLERTIEALQIIRKLWNKDQNGQEKNSNESQFNSNSTSGNDFITFDGQYFKTKEAKLYTSPSSFGNIPLYMAASGSESIQTAAVYTDGLITISKPDQAKEVLDKFDKAALEAGKDPQELEKIGKPRVSYSEDYDKAFKSSEFWRTTEIENVFNTEINNPLKLQHKAEEEVSDEKLRKSTLIVTSIEDLIKPLEEYFDVGYTQIYLQSTSPDEVEFIQQVCKKVLPYFRDSSK
jgi:coenzyme F420-dependent glucose-6-phosphate dehydrogenase